MLSVTGLNKFYYIRNFTNMRCKYSRVLAVIRHQLGRKPEPGDVFKIVVRIFHRWID
jgi:transposase